MKVIRDANRCELHGECVIAAPEVFEIEDDKDVVTVINPQPGEVLIDVHAMMLRPLPVDGVPIRRPFRRSWR